MHSLVVLICDIHIAKVIRGNACWGAECDAACADGHILLYLHRGDGQRARMAGRQVPWPRLSTMASSTALNSHRGSVSQVPLRIDRAQTSKQASKHRGSNGAGTHRLHCRSRVAAGDDRQLAPAGGSAGSAGVTQLPGRCRGSVMERASTPVPNKLAAQGSR